MPVAHSVLQDPVKKRRPLLSGARVVARQLDHRVLHQVQRLVAVAHGDFGDTQGAPLHLGQELVELPFLLQRPRLLSVLAVHDTAKTSAALDRSISLDSATR